MTSQCNFRKQTEAVLSIRMSCESRNVVGIGAVFSPKKGRVQFLSLDPACGAYQAGIRKNEFLEAIQVDGHEQSVKDVAHAASLVKGEPGTSFIMTIRHGKCDLMILTCILIICAGLLKTLFVKLL